MYKVMLVDDDYPVLEFLRSTIPWENMGFEITIAEEDSRLALKKAERDMPDVVITDIGMPHMNGIELLERMMEIDSKFIAVILSCHNEFQYAQEALKLGVFDYLLKETMTPELLAPVLERVVKKLHMEEQMVHEMDHNTQLAQRSREAYREKVIKQFLETPIFSHNEWTAHFQSLGVDFKLCAYSPVYIEIRQWKRTLNRFESEELLLFAVENLINEIMLKYDCPEGFRYRKLFFLMIPVHSEVGGSEELHAIQLLSNIQSSCKKFLKTELAITFESPCNSISDLKTKLKLLQENSPALFYEKTMVLKRNSDLRIDYAQQNLYDDYHEFFDTLRKFMLENSSLSIDHFIADCSLKWMEKRFNPEEVKGMYIRVAQDLQVKLATLQMDPRDLMKETLHETVQEIRSLSELEEWFRTFLTNASRQMREISNLSKRKEIIEARIYIATHLNKKITLEEVADILHLNPSYFSRLYKQETNEGFNEYVTRMKMERAKELLDLTDKSVEAIAYELGYDNKSYFNKCFKNYTGMPPIEYKLIGKNL